MIYVKNIAFYFLIAIAFKEVTSWTLDLPDVRKYFFSHNNEMSKNVINVDGRQPYNNINGNSLHNTDDKEYDHYVNELSKSLNDRYGFADSKGDGYIEKQVQEVVRKGGAYLDGLRRSLENYMVLLQNCSRTNFTDRSRIPLELPTPMPTPRQTPNTFQNTENGTFSQLQPNLTDFSNFEMRCRNATRKSEYVRRMSQLALHVTRRLEDVAYRAQYHKDSDSEKEENELILRLSYYLDQVAHITGYDPEVKKFVTVPTTRAPTTPIPFTLPFDNVPREIINMSMNCLDLKNKTRPEVPATIRCAFPLPIPEIMQPIFNGGSTTPMPSPDLQVMSLTQDNQAESSNELLIAADSARFPPQLTVDSAPKLTADVTSKVTAVRSKRAIDESKNPLIELMKYYAKHKVWLNSNPITKEKHFENFDVSNHLRLKRDLVKKAKHILPPIKALADYLKHKAEFHYVNNKVHADLIKERLNHIRHSLVVKHNFQKVFTKKVKRSVHYGQVYKPRVSEDPFQDISYYLKSKKGRTFNRNPVQAAQVRLGLEQVFQTGNIEVVRRYGSNFNPLIPNPFYAGVIATISDL